MSEPLADARDMFAVHSMFRREFGLMPDLVRAVPAGDQARTTEVADHVDLVSRILTLHHSGEDAHIWPRLTDRGGEEVASIVAVMEGQHEAIHEGLLEMAAAEKAWRATASAQTRDALADAVERFLPATTAHLALEEELVVPLIEKHVTQAEYAMLPAEGAETLPQDQLPMIFGMTMYEAEPDVIDMVVSHMPAEIQPVIRDLATKSYADYAQRLYGTATPPHGTI